MKYRIKEKNNRFFPQRKGWITVWAWEPLTRFANEQYLELTGKIHEGIECGSMSEAEFKTLKEAEQFIYEYKIQNESKYYTYSNFTDYHYNKIKNSIPPKNNIMILTRIQHCYKITYTFVTGHDPVPQECITYVWALNKEDAYNVFSKLKKYNATIQSVELGDPLNNELIESI